MSEEYFSCKRCPTRKLVSEAHFTGRQLVPTICKSCYSLAVNRNKRIVEPVPMPKMKMNKRRVYMPRIKKIKPLPLPVKIITREHFFPMTTKEMPGVDLTNFYWSEVV